MNEYTNDNDWEVREVCFPINEDDFKKSFFILKQEEQMQVIQLGLMIREIGMAQVKDLLEGINQKEQGAMKKHFSKIISELKENLSNQEKKYRLLQSNYQEEMQNVKTQIKEQQRDIYFNRISDLETNKNKLQLKIDELINERLLFQKNLHNESTKLLEKYQKDKEEIRQSYEIKLDEYRNKLETFNNINNNSAKKGQQGENWIYNELLRCFPCAEIEDHHKKGHAGDFSIKEEGKIGMLESKNYSRNVNKKEIEKFYKDIETNDQINYAIMASLKSGVVSREDFCLEFVSGKPVIFLHNVKDYPQNIKTAYKICQLILKNMDCFDIQKEENQHKIKIVLKTMKMRHKKLQTNLTNHIKKQKLLLDEQWGDFESMIELLNIHH